MYKRGLPIPRRVPLFLFRLGWAVAYRLLGKERSYAPEHLRYRRRPWRRQCRPLVRPRVSPGRAATKFLGPDICVGRDTRLSGTMLESALTAGIMAEGGRPHCCGVIPTPAVALLTVQNELDGGIVISASHNPPEFNGIKFLAARA